MPSKTRSNLAHLLLWGLSHSARWTIDRSIPATPDPVTLRIHTEVLQPMQAAAAAHGASGAACARDAISREWVEGIVKGPSPTTSSLGS